MITHLINICTKNTQHCYLCDLAHSGDHELCKQCWEDLPWQRQACKVCAIPLSTTETSICKDCVKIPPYFDCTFAALNYQFPINALLPQIKKPQAKHHLKWLTKALISKVSSHSLIDLPQALIPVPLSNIKKLTKGYNQTEQICADIQRSLKIEINSQLVSKIKHTQSQASLSAKERKTNLKNVFSALPTNLKHVAIIDDVMTTGSTANEIAKTLKCAGVEKVELWVIARTLT